MAKKGKKLLKKLAKAALIGGALYAGTKALGRKKPTVESVGVPEDVNINVNPLKKWAPGVGGKQHIPGYNWKTDRSIYSSAKGGRVPAKKGGRTGKQFGGGLGSTARRDMRSGYYPSDMGMRGGTMYKKGGRVKSRGVAKRGGGVEIK